MCDPREAVNCGFAERAVDEETVVVTDKGEGDDANCLEDTSMYY